MASVYRSMLGISSPQQLALVAMHSCSLVYLYKMMCTYQQNFDGNDPVTTRPKWIVITTRDGSPLTLDTVGTHIGSNTVGIPP